MPRGGGAIARRLRRPTVLSLIFVAEFRVERIGQGVNVMAKWAKALNRVLLVASLSPAFSPHDCCVECDGQVGKDIERDGRQFEPCI